MLFSSKVVAIGASTGGVEALETLMARFPMNIPPVVLVIHMPVGFTKLFAARLDTLLKYTVKEAQTGDILTRNQILIAPAGKHMKVVNKDGRLVVECFVGPKVQSVIPSADVLFESVAENIRHNAIGVILTGMGADGARGLLKMREKGAVTIGQDRETSAIYGMPKVAFEMGAVQYQLPLGKIADKIFQHV